MPTRYVRTRTNYIVSAVTDYSNPTIDNEFEDTATPDETAQIEVDAPTAGITLDLNMFDAITDIILRNNDATNYLRAQWYNQRGTATYATTQVSFNDANPDTITKSAGSDFNAAALDIVIGGYVRVTGATDAGNNATFLVQNVAAATVTLGTLEALTVRAADAGTPTLQSMMRNNMRVSAGQTIRLGPVAPELDILLTANTATVSCTLFIIGT